MASRLIHYLIAEEIAKVDRNIDRERFVYGALLPDLSLHEDGSYDNAHFGEVLIQKRLKGINWHNFRYKYNSQMATDSMFLGYYSHLVMDALWFAQIVDKYIRVYPKPERKIYYGKSYEDYKILNTLLTREYDLHYSLPVIENINIEEVNISLGEHFFEELKKDMLPLTGVCKDDLQLYPYKVIIDFLNQAKNLCLEEISAYRKSNDFLDPHDLYSYDK
jgi:hypothetical protein